MKLVSLFTFLILSAQVFAATYYSQSSSDPGTTSNWNTDRSGSGSAPANFSTGSDAFVIQSGHTMTTTGTWNLSGSSMTLQIEEGGILQADHTVDLTATSTLQIDNGGRLNHNSSDDKIYDGNESFGATSTLEIQSLPATKWGNHSLLFGNLIVNASSGGNFELSVGNGNTCIIQGDLTVNATGGGDFSFHTGATGTQTLRVQGDFNITGGIFNARTKTNIFVTTPIIEVGGDVNFTGGTWDHKGFDLEFILYDETVESIIELDGITIASNTIDGVDWHITTTSVVTLQSNIELGINQGVERRVSVEDGATLHFSSFYIFGVNGELYTESGTSIGIGSADGIDASTSAGNIRIPLVNRFVDLATNIIYNGTAAQVTGDALDDIGILTGSVQISNTTATVTATAGTDINFGDGFEFIVDENSTFAIGSGDNYIPNTVTTATLTINGSVEIDDADGFSASGTSGSEAFQGFTSCTFGDNGLINYNKAGAQAVTNQFNYGGLTLSGSGNKTMSEATIVTGNYTISGATAIYGTSIEFAGTNSKTISGDNYGTIPVILSGGGDKVLNSAATINSAITFTSGNLQLGNNDLTLGTSAVVSSANASSYLEITGTGNLIRTITNGTDYLFPIGTTGYLPATISCASCTDEVLSAGVEEDIYSDPTNPSSQTFSDAGYSGYVNNTWNLTTDGISGNVTVKLQWNSSNQSPDPGTSNASNNMALSNWENGSSSAWNAGTSTASANPSSGIYTQERTFNSLNSSEYFFGLGGNATPLPIELSAFDYYCLGNNLNFKWQTQTEINNSYFNLEASNDGIEFTAIATIQGSGTSYSARDYTFSLENNLPYTYYRLAQFDFDGRVEYSKVVAISCRQNANTPVIVGNEIRLKEVGDVEILDLNGRVIISAKQITQLNLNSLVPGVYLLKSDNMVKRFFIN